MHPLINIHAGGGGGGSVAVRHQMHRRLITIDNFKTRAVNRFFYLPRDTRMFTRFSHPGVPLEKLNMKTCEVRLKKM